VPEVRFAIDGARALAHSASPAIGLRLLIGADAPVQAILLRMQVRIDAAARPYSNVEREGLRELFGAIVRPLLWTTLSATIPSFESDIGYELEVPVSADLNLASTRYFHALQSGDVPLLLLFSGTIFHNRADGALQAAPIPWSREARFSLPRQTLRDAVEACFPNCGFLTLHNDVLDKLHRFKLRNGSPTWEHAIEALLEKSP
jgi:hypothetical protein